MCSRGYKMVYRLLLLSLFFRKCNRDTFLPKRVSTHGPCCGFSTQLQLSKMHKLTDCVAFYFLFEYESYHPKRGRVIPSLFHIKGCPPSILFFHTHSFRTLSFLPLSLLSLFLTCLPALLLQPHFSSFFFVFPPYQLLAQVIRLTLCSCSLLSLSSFLLHFAPCRHFFFLFSHSLSFSWTVRPLVHFHAHFIHLCTHSLALLHWLTVDFLQLYIKKKDLSSFFFCIIQSRLATACVCLTVCILYYLCVSLYLFLRPLLLSACVGLFVVD